MNRYYDYNNNHATITEREMLFCIAIFALMMLVGVFVSSVIKRFDNYLNLEYNQAMHITDDEEFRQAYRTGIGSAFVEGLLWCDGVNCPSIGKFCMCYVIFHQGQDNKGTWHDRGKESNYSPRLHFKGMVFNHYRFNFSNVPFEKIVVNKGYGRRDVVYICPRSFSCTVYCVMKNGGFAEPAMIYYDKTAEQARKLATKSNLVTTFWCIWTLVSVVVCGVFVCFDNNWLEDDKRDYHYQVVDYVNKTRR